MTMTRDDARSEAADRWRDEATPAERAQVAGRWPGDLPGVRVIRYPDGSRMIAIDGEALREWRRVWPCSGTRGASVVRLTLDPGGVLSAVSLPGAAGPLADNEMRAILSGVLT